jgi:hypothetical protein
MFRCVLLERSKQYLYINVHTQDDMKIVQKEHIKESQIKKIFLDLFSFFAKEGVTVHCVFQLT